jgi:hypothetical protein
MPRLMIAVSVSALSGRLVAIDLRRSVIILLVATCLAGPPTPANAQTLSTSETPASLGAGSTATQSYLSYSRPTQTTKLHNYPYYAFGPYPITVSAFGAGIQGAQVLLRVLEEGNSKFMLTRSDTQGVGPSER